MWAGMNDQKLGRQFACNRSTSLSTFWKSALGSTGSWSVLASDQLLVNASCLNRKTDCNILTGVSCLDASKIGPSQNVKFQVGGHGTRTAGRFQRGAGKDRVPFSARPMTCFVSARRIFGHPTVVLKY